MKGQDIYPAVALFRPGQSVTLQGRPTRPVAPVGATDGSEAVSSPLLVSPPPALTAPFWSYASMLCDKCLTLLPETTAQAELLSMAMGSAAGPAGGAILGTAAGGGKGSNVLPTSPLTKRRDPTAAMGGTANSEVSEFVLGGGSDGGVRQLAMLSTYPLFRLLKPLCATLCTWEPTSEAVGLLPRVTALLHAAEGVRLDLEGHSMVSRADDDVIHESVDELMELEIVLGRLGGRLAASAIQGYELPSAIEAAEKLMPSGTGGGDGEGPKMEETKGFEDEQQEEKADADAKAKEEEEEEAVKDEDEAKMRAVEEHWMTARLLEGGFRPTSAASTTAADPGEPASSGHSPVDQFLSELTAGKGAAAEVDKWVMDHIGPRQFKKWGGEKMAEAMRGVVAATLYHTGLVNNAMAAAVQIQEAVEGCDPADPSQAQGKLADMNPDEGLIKAWRKIIETRSWALKYKRSTGIADGPVAGRIMGKVAFLRSLVPRMGQKSGDDKPSDAGGERVKGGLGVAPGPVPGAGSGSAVAVAATAGVSEGQQALMDEVAKFIQAKLRLKRLTIHIEQSIVLASTRHAGLKAARTLLRFDNLPATVRAAIISNLGSVFRVAETSTRSAKQGDAAKSKSLEDEAKASGSTATAALTIKGVHYMEGLEMSGWEQRVGVKKNFDALFMRLGEELRSSIELSDLELQLVLLDAWGLIMRPEDHALLLQVRPTRRGPGHAHIDLNQQYECIVNF